METLAFLRSFRAGPFAIFDFVASFAFVYLIAPLLSRASRRVGLEVTRASWLWLTLPIAFLAHLLAGTDTPLTRMVLDPAGHFTAKALLVAMLYLGVRKIERTRSPRPGA
jgi:hypothetical protein